MKYLLSLFLLYILFFNINIKAQENYFLVSGKILDNNNFKEIPYVNIYVEGSTMGTITNKDGDYELKIPLKFKEKVLVFSCIGYETQEHKINSILNVNLKEKLIKLEEVTVNPIKPIELLQQAIKKIPQNYPTNAVYYDAFYRSLTKENNKYVRLLEASCIYNYASYIEIFDITNAQKMYFRKNKNYNCSFNEGMNNWFDLYVNPNDQVKIIESRISEDNSSLGNEILLVGGPLNLIATDKVKYLNAFLNKKHFNHYKYSEEKTVSFDNKDVYVVSFKPKLIQFRDKNPGIIKFVNRRKYLNAEFEGKIYIEAENKAIIRIEYNIVYKNSLRKRYPYPYSVRIDYKQIKNKWYLSQILRKRSNKEYLGKNDTLSVEEQLIINNVRLNNINNFSKSEIFPHSRFNSLYKVPMNYNQEYWDKYNIVTHNKIQTKAIIDLEKNKALVQQYKDMQVRNDSLPTPVAIIKDSSIKIHNRIIMDEYKWLENIDDENVQQYIKKENKYTYNYFIPYREIQNTLFKEMSGTNKKQNGIYNKKKNNDYEYYQRYKPELEYPILCRKKNVINAKEEIMFDFNAWADNYDYFNAFIMDISPDNKNIAIGVDKDGSENMTCFFIDTKQKTIKKDSINNIWNLVWINNEIFFYVVQDSLNRPSSVFKHKLNQGFSQDKLIHYENDKYFDVNIRKSELANYIFLEIFNYNTSELRYIDINKPNESFKIFYPREKTHFYKVKETKNEFYVISNKDAINNRLFKTLKNNTNFKNWKEVIPTRADTLLNGFYITQNYLILSEIHNVKQNLRIINLKKNVSNKIKIKEQFYSLNLLEHNYYSNKLKINVSTFIKPSRIYEFNMISKKMILLEEDKIENYLPKDYRVTRIWATVTSKTKIPITLIYKKEYTKEINGIKRKVKTKINGKNPLILEAYGSFGNGIFPYFSRDRLSLLNRGFVYATAHVRGGNELGNEWHKSGKLLNKKNTFDDYIACAEYLINKHYTDSNLLFGLGGSAGGLLMGAVANKKPELFKGIILEYPQVCQLDALKDSTMNHGEFGNPYKKEYFKYIHSYSPYENIKKQKYPAMLLISGLKDERVKYWQATKMTARLRKNNISNLPILLKTYNSGHIGQSGRDSYYRSMALEYSFFLSLLK